MRWMTWLLHEEIQLINFIHSRKAASSISASVLAFLDSFSKHLQWNRGNMVFWTGKAWQRSVTEGISLHYYNIFSAKINHLSLHSLSTPPLIQMNPPIAIVCINYLIINELHEVLIQIQSYPIEIDRRRKYREWIWRISLLPFVFSLGFFPLPFVLSCWLSLFIFIYHAS